MSLDHDAIYKAYPNVASISSETDEARDNDGNLVTLEQSKIDAARATINSELAAAKYKDDRRGRPYSDTTNEIYPDIGDQLDLLYKDIIAGTLTASGGFATKIKATKDKYPKP